eukprot:TRINITY_DN60983_c0_g1_i1.p1 TRINITY_DN60983_c0_g1~~TRINITY_DN60983_c0_g1_i1.p1  ORF type:complete len:387 (+),score=75.80 TRINITY_DN60983_c0_g1_i1:93-1253(+)
MGAASAALTACSSPPVSKPCECELGRAAQTGKPRLRVGCAIGVKSSPAKVAMHRSSNLEDRSFILQWPDIPPDPEALAAMLSAGLLDVALFHTEEIIQVLAGGSSLRVCGTFTSSPRHWGIYAFCGRLISLEAAGDSQASPLGVPSNSLGAQLVLHMLGEQTSLSRRGGLFLRQLPSIEAAHAALSSGTVQAVLWERHATHDYVSCGKWVAIGETDSPWASTLLVTNKEAIYSKGECIKDFLSWAKLAAWEFHEDGDAAEMALEFLQKRYHMGGLSVRHWLSSISWKCVNEVEVVDLTSCFKQLQRAGLISQAASFSPEVFVARRICDLLETDRAGEEKPDHGEFDEMDEFADTVSPTVPLVMAVQTCEAKPLQEASDSDEVVTSF